MEFNTLENKMDEKQKSFLYNDNDATFDASSKRRMAVEVALDLIRHEAMSGSSRNSVDFNLRHLSDFADYIQEALRGGEQEVLRGKEREALRGRERETSRGQQH
ncbi:MAG TPA: hypothetical protein VNN25_11520 [Thermoanaerobaculia bacterium]|jgi:hypothetical protein|nr:hypothetical protein [Thermoanaerobaculia bacterium]